MGRENQPDLVGRKCQDKAILIALIIYIIVFAVIILRLSIIRVFNFDEFQVIYASASLLRGKALYADNIGVHFPFVNILFSFLIKVLGFHTSSILAARLLTLLFLYLTLFFTYKIAGLLWDRLSGVLAVALIMATIVFIDKGIEIRHDIFNMAFNTIGAYCGIKYLKEKDPRFILLSGLLMGLALASTQKAIVWNIGITAGLFSCMIIMKSSRKLPGAIALYGGGLIIPLIVSMVYLVLAYDEQLRSTLEVSVINASGYLDQGKANEVYPFAYRRSAIFKILFYENGFFYILSLLGLFTTLVRWFRRDVIEGVIGFWALAGILFYLYTSRPFLQSLLPTIPALGILAAGFIVKYRNGLGQNSWIRNPLVGLVALVLLLGWPSYIIAFKLADNQTMTEQMENISFCLSNLKSDDRVLCFSQQQIFFDPVFDLYGDECGRSIHAFDARCFEKRMIRQKCKVVIYDRRTSLLSDSIQNKLREHFYFTNIGNIFAPGILIAPQSVIEKKMWVAGPYYCPTRKIVVDGKRIKDKIIYLEQRTYMFENPTVRPVPLFYIFNKERLVERLAKKGIR